MTKDELKELIATTLVGQGNQVDIGNNLSDILKETISLAAPSGAEELNALVDSVIGGQGNQIDVGGALGTILNALADSVTFSGDMTKEEVVALINDAIVGQGNQIDASGKLPTILDAIVENVSGGITAFFASSTTGAFGFIRNPIKDEQGYFAWATLTNKAITWYTEKATPEVGDSLYKKNEDGSITEAANYQVAYLCYGSQNEVGTLQMTWEQKLSSGSTREYTIFRDSRLDMPERGLFGWNTHPSLETGNGTYTLTKTATPSVGTPTYKINGEDESGLMK